MFRIFVAGAVLSVVGWAQVNPGIEAGNGNVGSTTNGSAGPLSGSNPNLIGTVTMGHAIFLSGAVMFDDGTPPNNQIKIERFCGAGGVRLETHTDAKGHFSFQVGGEQGNNASDAEYSSSTFGGKNGLSAAAGNTGAGRGISLIGCELRAVYPGYVSDRIDISSHHAMDDSKVGTLVLHRATDVKGTTVSATSAEAPKTAQKNFAKGVAAAEKGKYAEAESHLIAATGEFGRYAVAWAALGEVEEQLNKPTEAKQAYLAAASADSHFVTPDLRLARLAMVEKNWTEGAKYSEQVVGMNSVEFPAAFWYDALASYNLKNFAEAEKSARALVAMDSQHKYAEAESMLAEFTAKRGQLDEAEAHIKAYLAEAPNARNAEMMKRELAQIETVKAAQGKD